MRPPIGRREVCNRLRFHRRLHSCILCLIIWRHRRPSVSMYNMQRRDMPCTPAPVNQKLSSTVRAPRQRSCSHISWCCRSPGRPSPPRPCSWRTRSGPSQAAGAGPATTRPRGTAAAADVPHRVLPSLWLRGIRLHALDCPYEERVLRLLSILLGQCAHEQIVNHCTWAANVAYAHMHTRMHAPFVRIRCVWTHAALPCFTVCEQHLRW